MPTAATPLPGLDAHPHARAVLGAAVADPARASHAYLLAGPAGTGKRATARAFAAELLADGAADPDGVRGRVQRGTHPDLTWVTPSGAHELLVGDVRDAVVAQASQTPFEADRRVFVIERVDTMNDEAANRMLKTLEEPARFVHLLLLTSRPSDVLPTIASRCQLVRFDPLPEQVLVDRLARTGVAPETALACARLAGGDADRALDLAAGPGAQARVQAERIARAAFAGTAPAQRPWTSLLAAAKEAGQRAEAQVDAALQERLALLPKADQRRAITDAADEQRRARRRAERAIHELALELVGRWCRDAACVAHGAPELVANADRAAEIAADAAGRNPHRLLDAVDAAEATRAGLVLNLGEELAWDALGARLHALLATRP